MHYKTLSLWLAALGFIGTAAAQPAAQSLRYRVETGGNVSNGKYAPLWFTANRYGLSSAEANSGYLRAGVDYRLQLPRHWKLHTGLDLAAAVNQTAGFVVQQAFADLSWKQFTLSIGSKERPGFPLQKNTALSSGMMVEGPNARPVPQVRAEISRYLPVPGTRGWLALKGHLAYGQFTDGRWQRHFAAAGQNYGTDIRYHSKSLMFRLGNRRKLPVEFEFGMLMAAQFAGDQWRKNADGSSSLMVDMPDGADSYLKAFFPSSGGSDTPWGDQVNVEGNHVGSWNFALNYYGGSWKVRAYLEHFFDDHSQMTWQYGRWKDGQLGLEITLPRNRWVNTVVWETMSTKDQTGPLLYDSFAGSLGYQVSAGDNYYNNYLYQGWQHWGMGMGNPLLPGPLYNADGSITFKSNRVKSQHLGFDGQPAPDWSYRVLLSYARHWGTYAAPLDKVRHNFSSLYEVTWTPARARGWSASLSLGLDRGNYPGNSTGGMLTLRKEGIIF